MRITDCSSDIGFSSTTGARRAGPSRRATSGAVKLQPTASESPAPTERVLGAAAQPLLGREPADRAAARRQRGREPVQPPEPRDLLDQVGLALDVARGARPAR